MASYESLAAGTDRAPGRMNSDRIFSAKAAEEVPELICKKWLCARFSISTRSGRASKRMRKLLFTDELLRLLNISESEWKRRQEFTRAESIVIIRYLELA